MSQPEKNPNQTTPQSEKQPLTEKRKRALLVYLAILFCAAFILVLMSLLIQMRDSSLTITQLSQTSTSALANAQRLQDDNSVLREEVDALQEELRVLQQSLKDATDGAEKAKADADAEMEQLAEKLSALETELEAQKQQNAQTEEKVKAYRLFMLLLAEDDPTKAEALLAEVEPLESLLDPVDRALLSDYQLPADTAEQPEE